MKTDRFGFYYINIKGSFIDGYVENWGNGDRFAAWGLCGIKWSFSDVRDERLSDHQWRAGVRENAIFDRL
tara:strand:+ start:1520 stop:1729 length:210 start_codon:yes stop_codon:yes gene_type:complete